MFSKYLYYYLIFQTKKVYIPRHHFRKCNSHCHFLRHSQIIYFLYFYIFAFFYAQRLFCSSQILFHWQFPQISLRLSIARIFSWTFFVTCQKKHKERQHRKKERTSAADFLKSFHLCIPVLLFVFYITRLYTRSWPYSCSG